MNLLAWLTRRPERPADSIDTRFEQARQLSSAFTPGMPEGCSCHWHLAAGGRPFRQAQDPACAADHDGSSDPRQRMRGLRQ